MRHTDGQNMGICYQELLRIRDKHILGNLETSNAFDLFSELVGFYYSRDSGCMLGHIMQARPWDYEEIEAYKKRPNAIVFDKSNWQGVTLRALAYVDRHLTPVIKGYGTGYACDSWRALMNGFNEFPLEILAKMMFTQCNAIYYHCLENYCFCLDTSKALKPLQLIKR